MDRDIVVLYRRRGRAVAPGSGSSAMAQESGSKKKYLSYEVYKS